MVCLTKRSKLMEFFELKKVPGPGMCPVKGCRKNAHERKAGLCHAHFQEKWRRMSPKKSAYALLRDHAKARGIKFAISSDYFEGLTDAFGYWVHQPSSHGEILTIDRIDATKGYEPGNLTIISHSANSSKGAKERWLPEHIQHILERKRGAMQPAEEPRVEEDDESNPF